LDVPIYFKPEFPILLSLFVSSHNLFIYNDETAIHFNHSNGTEGKNRETDAQENEMPCCVTNTEHVEHFKGKLR
jgi:hypothetical protein